MGSEDQLLRAADSSAQRAVTNQWLNKRMACVTRENLKPQSHYAHVVPRLCLSH